MKQANMCIHFRGIQYLVCAAGVKLRSVRDESQPGPYRWPCLTLNGKEATTTCALRVYPTAEQIAEEEARMAAAFQKLFIEKHSMCCNAPLDESRVKDGTGFRLCSKCGAVAYHGCGGGDVPDDDEATP